MHYRFPQKVLFKHCDPAGIVFYPRYFEIINDAVEAMFTDLLGWPFEVIHKDAGVPTASFKVEFRAPSRHGDHIELQITLKSCGRASLTLQIDACAGEQTRFNAEQVLVHVGPEGRAAPWPAHIREKIDAIMEVLS